MQQLATAAGQAELDGYRWAAIYSKQLSGPRHAIQPRPLLGSSVEDRGSAARV